MEWQEYTIWISESQAVEAAAEILREFGSSGVVVKYPEAVYNNEVFIEEWAHLDKEYRDLARTFTAVSGYFSEPQDLMKQLENKAQALAGYLDIKVVVSYRQLSESYWQQAWKKYFHAQKIGEKLIIKPSWEDYEGPDGMALVELDPGLAFGTGLHPTTRFCLELLEQFITINDVVLDAGTGSGILAITAARLGAARVSAVELDEIAVAIAAENVANNSLQNVIQVSADDVLQFAVPATYDLILANLTADLIGFMAPTAYTNLQPEGFFIVSGILRELWEVTQAKLLAAGFKIVQTKGDETWMAAVCGKSI